MALVTARTAAGVTQRELAASCGVSSSLVQRWEDPEDPCQMGLHDLACAPKQIARALLSELADAHGLLAVDTPTTASDLGSLHDHVTAATRFLQAFADGSADGEWTADELQRVERDGTEMIETGLRAVNAAKERRRGPLRSVR